MTFTMKIICIERFELTRFISSDADGQGHATIRFKEPYTTINRRVVLIRYPLIEHLSDIDTTKNKTISAVFPQFPFKSNTDS